jgi:hypothetical protein
MTRDKFKQSASKKTARAYVGRGEIYCWLRAHYRRVARLLDRQERTWGALVDEMSRDGVKARGDRCLTANAVLRVWQRVCRDVEREQDGTRAKRKKPSHIAPGWRPQEVVEPPPVHAPAAEVAVDLAPPRQSPRHNFDESPSVREQLAKMDELFAKHDRKFKF